ncbi:uncharacterized protein LOC141631406 [Silene latifolia]|uniref:uncharacterized protein LOC141631406 n=1 Tax=Silene latifolia TaxID=37657 RepID=UPI003D777F13
MVYDFNGQHEREPLWDSLRKNSNLVNGPWAIARDFNCVLNASERVGGNTPAGEMEPFRRCIADCGVVDVAAVGALFSWNNKQKPEERIYSRIDRFLVNQDWCNSFSDIYAHFLPEGLMDHTPCLLKSTNHSQGKRNFKYYNMWGGSEKFIPLVRENWDLWFHFGTPMFRLAKNLKATILQKKVEGLQERINRDPTNVQKITEEYEASLHLQELAKARESFVAQKSKHKWIKDGDANTSYFHGLLKRRRNMNNVAMIEDMNGKVCDTKEQIQKAFIDYYQLLLGSSKETKKIHRRIIAQGSVCTADHWHILRKPLTGEEIKEALFSIPDIKSPGPDGYTSKFFKDAWGEIGGDVIRAVQDFFQSRQLLKKFNSTNVTLIPKCDRPKSVLQFRPIACCNVVYKVISKLLCSYASSKPDFHYHPMCKKQSLTSLMFADDVMLFSKGDATSMMLLLQSFSTFSNASELQTTRLWKQDCECLVDKICARIHGYGARKFSYAGRLVIVKSVLNSLHSYWASMFVLPKGIIKRIEAVCRNFLWDNSADYRRAPLVGWDTICRPKDEGGLGIKDQESWNKAMVGRLVDWVATQRDSIWVNWVQSNYLKGQEWMEYKPSSNSSWVWRRICKVKEEMRNGYVNGEWSVQPGGYSPAGCYDWFRGTRPRIQWDKAVWNGWTIPKHQFLGWMVAHKALNTAERLVRFGVIIEDKCYLCGIASETIEHLFCECPYSRRVVLELNRNTTWTFPVRDLVEWCSFRTGTGLQKGVQNAIVMSLMYRMAKERNRSRNEMTLLRPERVAGLMEKIKSSGTVERTLFNLAYSYRNRFSGCSVQLLRTFYAKLNKDEAARMEAVKGIRRVMRGRDCIFDV